MRARERLLERRQQTRLLRQCAQQHAFRVRQSRTDVSFWHAHPQNGCRVLPRDTGVRAVSRSSQVGEMARIVAQAVLIDRFCS